MGQGACILSYPFSSELNKCTISNYLNFCIPFLLRMIRVELNGMSWDSKKKAMSMSKTSLNILVYVPALGCRQLCCHLKWH